MPDSPIFSSMASDPEFHDLVLAFVEELPFRSDNILTHVKSGDLEDAAELLHQLKGAAGIYGFHPIHHLATEVESLARNSDENTEEAAIKLSQMCRRATAEPE